MSKARLLAAALAVVALGASSVALGLPWDIDMADGQAKKAYARDMNGLPAEVVAQASPLSPMPFVQNHKRGSAEGEALVNPLPADAATLARGKAMYNVYCTPCHGADGINLGAVAQPGRLPGVVPLAGPAGVAKFRSDGWIYLTIRNGGAVMPSYGWAMSEDEIWSTVAYTRTLSDAKFVPPTPKE